MSIIIRIAEEKDLLPVQRLVAKAGISEQGIENHIKDFLVVEDEHKQIIGTVGIEQLGTDGLMRSLVIQTENARLGLEFVQLAIAYAEEKNIEKLYLLTKRSIPLFDYLGFETVEEKNIPTHLKQSTHFAQYQQGITKVMVCHLGKNS